MDKMTFIATCLLGLESIVKDELKSLGYNDLKVCNGYVEFTAGFDAIAKTNLWLRCADRVFLQIGSFKAIDFDMLFEGVKALNWLDYLPLDACFPVSNINIKNSKIFSKSDSQAIIKKAVVNSLKTKYNLEQFPETGALFSIRINIVNDIVSVYLDTTGEALNKRGYRAHHGGAPIRETLAAALVKLSRWGRFAEMPLMDPLCGTGTILIESAMIAKNIAPGKYRNFVSEDWDFIPKEVWELNRQQVIDLEKKDLKLNIMGSDNNVDVLRIARKNVTLAGLEDDIILKKSCIKDISSKYDTGVIITNPPYGERLSEKKEVEILYKEMGNIFLNKFSLWAYYIITSNIDFEKLFGENADKNRKLYNGGMKCYLFQYFK